MQLTPVNELPVAKANCQYKNCKEYIDEFMNMDTRCVHVNFAPYEFANTYSAYASFQRVIKLYDLPVRASIINSELYLIKLNKEV